MDDKRTVPYIVYESAQARAERRDKRHIIALIIITAMLFVTNIIWVYEWSQYDYCSEEIAYQQDGMGINSINTGAADNVRFYNYEPEDDN